MIFLTAVISFIGTNLDDLLVLMFLYAQTGGKNEKRAILMGRYLGFGVILGISLLGAFGLSLVSDRFLGLLGILPIVLGIREWMEYRRASEPEAPTAQEPKKEKTGSRLFAAAALAVSNGADNIGVYLPLFTGYTAVERALFTAVFLIMTAVWCFLGDRLAGVPVIREKLRRYQPILVPLVFVLLGVYILGKSYL